MEAIKFKMFMEKFNIIRFHCCCFALYDIAPHVKKYGMEYVKEVDSNSYFNSDNIKMQKRPVNKHTIIKSTFKIPNESCKFYRNIFSSFLMSIRPQKKTET